MVRLTKSDKDKLWRLFSDGDISEGSDGYQYIHEKALLWYYNVKLELETMIDEVQKPRGQKP